MKSIVHYHSINNKKIKPCHIVYVFLCGSLGLDLNTQYAYILSVIAHTMSVQKTSTLTPSYAFKVFIFQWRNVCFPSIKSKRICCGRIWNRLNLIAVYSVKSILVCLYSLLIVWVQSRFQCIFIGCLLFHCYIMCGCVCVCVLWCKC